MPSTGRLNLLFNNAGVALSGTLRSSDDANLQWITNINYWGVVHGCRAFLPLLIESGEGHIINTSSISGLIAQPGMGAYNATKFAVRGFSECLRMELELEQLPVSLTCVHPGGIKTAIAAKSRYDQSTQALSKKDPDTARADFEKLFITSADDAARTILKAVRRDRRRVLVGVDARGDRLGAAAAAHRVPGADQAPLRQAAGRLRPGAVKAGPAQPCPAQSRPVRPRPRC